MENKSHNSFSPVVLTGGDPAGIGPELIFACTPLIAESDETFLCFLQSGARDILSFQKQLSEQNCSSEVLTKDQFYENYILNTKNFSQRVLIVDLSSQDSHKDWSTGKPGLGSGYLAFLALELACDFIVKYGCRGLCTAPVSKEWIARAIERDFPGHTDYLAERFQKEVLMLMYGRAFSVIPLTMHIPLKDVSTRLRTELGKQSLSENLLYLSDTDAFKNTKWALCGINPHAGEGGYLGTEEIDFMDSVCVEWKKLGMNVDGPLPSDSVFLKENISGFKLVLCAYHDQALIPFKAIVGREGVNCTIGLPFLRTSPDHGTAYGIAGKNISDPLSMKNALELILNGGFEKRNG